jgi:hypothetical protein
MDGRAPPDAPTRAGSGQPRPAVAVAVAIGASGRRTGGRCPVRVPGPAVGTSVQPVSGRPASRCPVSRRPLHPGVRTDRPPVSAARCRAVRAALDWSGSCGGPPRVGRSGSTCPVVRGRHGRLHRAGRQGVVRRWPCLARTRLTPAQGRRWAGVPAAGPPGRRADTGAGPGPGCRLGGGGAWDRAGAHQPPQGVLGRSPAPGHGPGPRGGDHATWSLGEGWSRVVRLRRATGFGWGAACGRSTAAAHEERCPLGADRSLTREDSGGRDRV